MRRRKQNAGDYEVGYGRPPLATRFQPGQSGNPKGRPKARKTVGEDLRDAMMAKVRVMENGRTRLYTVQQVIVRGLVAEAARKNLRAIAAVLSMEARYGAAPDTMLDPADLPPEDREIIQGFIDQVKEGSGNPKVTSEEADTSGPDAADSTAEKGDLDD